MTRIWSVYPWPNLVQEIIFDFQVGNLNRLEHLKFGQSDKINISFSNLTYRVPETSHCAHRGFKTILKNVSGEFRSGQERRHIES